MLCGHSFSNRTITCRQARFGKAKGNLDSGAEHTTPFGLRLVPYWNFVAFLSQTPVAGGGMLNPIVSSAAVDNGDNVLQSF
jgi:hypothetical protein